MLRTLSLLSLMAILEACSGFGTARTYVPSSPPEMRTAASAMMGTDVSNTLLPDPRNPSPAIELKPSPGKAPMFGERTTEVLRSDAKSGAYIAFTGQVPPTRYFEVIARADCDDWVYLQLMNADMLLNRPQYYGGGEYSGDKAAVKCARSFHQKFREKQDERLRGADGAIFDAASAEFTDVDGWFNQSRKVHMDGWAIKFVSPDVGTIRARLIKPATTPIDVMQLRAAAFWVEKNHVTELATELRGALRVGESMNNRSGWGGAGPALLRALATVEDATSSDDLFRSIIGAGVVEMLRPGNQTTVAAERMSDVPFVAANVMVCRNHPGAKEEFRRVLLEGTIRQHKLASAKGLIALGDLAFLRKSLKDGQLGDVSTTVESMLSGIQKEPFACPYRSKASA